MKLLKSAAAAGLGAAAMMAVPTAASAQTQPIDKAAVLYAKQAAQGHQGNPADNAKLATLGETSSKPTMAEKPAAPSGDYSAEKAAYWRSNDDGRRADASKQGEMRDSSRPVDAAAASKQVQIADTGAAGPGKNGMTGLGGPVEAVDTYPPCRPGPGDDRCIQLYERGVTGRR